MGGLETTVSDAEPYKRREPKPGLQLLALSGIAVPIIRWLAFLLLGSSRSDYNLLLDAASKLGEKGAPNAAIFNLANFEVAGVLLIAFAFALYRGMESKISAALVALGGISSIFAGVFTLDPTSPQADNLHQAVGIPGFVGLPLAAIFMGRALRSEPRWRKYRRFTLLIGVLFLLIVVVGIPATFVGLPVGIFQRTVMTVGTLWLLVTSGWMLRLARV